MRRPVAVVMATAAVLVFGLVSYARLPLALFPDLTYPTLTIRTSYPGAAPEEIEESVVRPIEELVVTGGGSQSALWCQIIADVSGKRVRRARTTEATALGAGMLAAVAAGLYPSLDRAVAAMTSTAEVFDPGPDHERYDRLYFEVYDGLYAALTERMHKLATLRASVGG